MTTKTHSARAMEAALKAFDGTSARNAAVLLFFASARHMAAVLDDPKAAGELAYIAADELTVGRFKR